MRGLFNLPLARADFATLVAKVPFLFETFQTRVFNRRRGRRDGEGGGDERGERTVLTSCLGRAKPSASTLRFTAFLPFRERRGRGGGETTAGFFASWSLQRERFHRLVFHSKNNLVELLSRSSDLEEGTFNLINKASIVSPAFLTS
ncbi:hypothetical protein TNCV_4314211 [Trichonephila clavipes]|nr:hypothetical protein TNCV_4314211 [Trichonephila clavipes]